MAIDAARSRSFGGLDVEALMSFLVASNVSSRSCKLDGRWYTDSSSSSSLCDSPLVSGGVVEDADDSSSTRSRSGADVFLMDRPVSSEDTSFSGATTAGIVAALTAGDFDTGICEPLSALDICDRDTGCG